MNRLAVVVLNWNGADLLGACFDSLASQSHNNFQIIAVDNYSTDNSRDILNQQQKKLKSKLHVIYNKKNSGFAGGVNVGIVYALKQDFDGVALFNNDATADKDWLKTLSHTLETKPEVGIITGLLLHQDGKTIDSSGDWYSVWGLSYPRGRDLPAKTAPDSGLVFGASGGASLYRCAMLKEVGLFDETFFMYYEDVDVSFRAQLAGWKVFYNNRAIAYHEQGGTSKKMPKMPTYQTFKNLPMIYLKNVPHSLLLKIGLRFFLAYWLMFFNTVRYGTFLYALRGWTTSIWFTPKALRQRSFIQKSKKVDDTYLASILWPSLPPDQSGLRKFMGIFRLKKY